MYRFMRDADGVNRQDGKGDERYMNVRNGARRTDENYFCHIIIPSRNYQRSRVFYENVFGWRVQKQPGTSSLDILPTSRKGPSAELNSGVEAVIPSILTSDIEAKLKLIEKFCGKTLKGKTPTSKTGEHGYYALFQDPHGITMCLYSEE